MSRHKGNEAEDRAVDFLKNMGFEILCRNFYTRFGEIDIVAKKRDVLHFVEVKSGINFEPIYGITAQKLTRISKSIDCYLRTLKKTPAYCIDAVIIKKSEIEFLENITMVK